MMVATNWPELETSTPDELTAVRFRITVGVAGDRQGFLVHDNRHVVQRDVGLIGMQVCEPKPLPVMVMVSLGSTSVLLTLRTRRR